MSTAGVEQRAYCDVMRSIWTPTIGDHLRQIFIFSKAFSYETQTSKINTV